MESKDNSLLQNRFELPSFFHVPVVVDFSGTGCTSGDFWFQRNTTCGYVKTGALQMISKRLYDRRKSVFFSDGFLMMRMLPNKESLLIYSVLSPKEGAKQSKIYNDSMAVHLEIRIILQVVGFNSHS